EPAGDELLADVRQPRDVEPARDLDLPLVGARGARRLVRPEGAHSVLADSLTSFAPLGVAVIVRRIGALMFGGKTIQPWSLIEPSFAVSSVGAVTFGCLGFGPSSAAENSHATRLSAPAASRPGADRSACQSPCSCGWTA